MTHEDVFCLFQYILKIMSTFVNTKKQGTFIFIRISNNVGNALTPMDPFNIFYIREIVKCLRHTRLKS